MLQHSVQDCNHSKWLYQQVQPEPSASVLQVWFLGKADAQKVRGNPHLQKTNFGYDDERGDYHVVPSDHIAYRYEVCSVLGKGSFGQVLKVLDYKTGTWKALKIIRNKKRFHHQVGVTAVTAWPAAGLCCQSTTCCYRLQSLGRWGGALCWRRPTAKALWTIPAQPCTADSCRPVVT